jgi:hypothetical protein
VALLAEVDGLYRAVIEAEVFFSGEARTMLSRTGLLDFLGGAGAEFMDEICGLLRMRSGGENRAAVVLQNFQPIGDIGGVVFAGLQR